MWSRIGWSGRACIGRFPVLKPCFGYAVWPSTGSVNQLLPFGRQASSGEDAHLTPLNALAPVVKLPMSADCGGLAGKCLDLAINSLGWLPLSFNDEIELGERHYLVDRRTPMRYLLQALVDQPQQPRRLVALDMAAERPLTHP